MVPLVAREEAADSGSEGYEGKASKSICSGGQVAELWEPCQELSDLEGCRPHIPRDSVRVMSRTAEEVGHSVVGRAAFGAVGVIGPAWERALGAGRGRCGRAVGAVVRLGQLEGGGHEQIIGCLGPDGLLNYPASKEASGILVGALFQHAPKDEGGELGSSPLTCRPLIMRWNEAWRVALRGRWSWGGGDDQMTGVQGLEGGSVELLTTQFHVRSQGEDPSVCSEVGRRGLLMASVRDPQGLVLDHLKLVQVG